MSTIIAPRKDKLELVDYFRALRVFMLSGARRWIFFRLDMYETFIGSITQAATFYFMRVIIGGKTAQMALAAYGGDFISFAILGFAFMIFLNQSLSHYYWELMDSWSQGRLEALLLSPMNVPTLVIGGALWRYVLTTITCAIYFATGVLLFGVNLKPASSYGIGLLILVLGVIATTGIGLIAASMFILLNIKGQLPPISWLVKTLSGLLCGLYFPVSVLPGWLQRFAFFLPQTYALDGARRALLPGSLDIRLIEIEVALDPIMLDILMLSIFCLILVPLGYMIFKHSIKMAEKKGLLSRWTT